MNLNCQWDIHKELSKGETDILDKRLKKAAER